MEVIKGLQFPVKEKGKPFHNRWALFRKPCCKRVDEEELFNSLTTRLVHSQGKSFGVRQSKILKS